MLQATRHQGALVYKGGGKQCVANSIHAILLAHEIPPSYWTQQLMNGILDNGDKLYSNIVSNTDKTYLSLEDIPHKLDNVRLHINRTMHGTLSRDKSEDPFFSLEDSLDNLLTSGANCLLTMGSSSPCYTCAIMREGDTVYFFDPHSRSETGMVSADGRATMTVHKRTAALGLFIRHLAASIQKTDMTFEMSQLNTIDNVSDPDSDSHFSGFSSVSEGELTCRLYLAGETLSELEVSDVSSISTCSCCNEDDVISNYSFHSNKKDGESDKTGDATVLHDALKDMTDSVHILKSSNSDVNSACDDTVDNLNDNACVCSASIDTCTTSSTCIPGSDITVTVYVTQDSEDDCVNQSISGSDEAVINVDADVDECIEDDDGGDIGGDDEDDNDDVYIGDNEDGGDDDDDDDDESDDDTPLIKLAQDNIRNKKFQNQTKYATNVVNQTAPAENGKSRCRKRVRNVEEWKRNIMKRRRNEGKEYITRTGNAKKARTVKPGCGLKCRYKCHQHVNETERQKLFHGFWNLGDINKQRSFISKFATMKKKEQKKGKSQRRTHSVSYNFPIQDAATSKVVKVCKTFFLHTLSVSERYVYTSHSLSKMGICHDDRRGKHKNRPYRTSHEQETLVRSHIESFPTMESHYCRKDTKREYLGPDLNVPKMYCLYKEMCADKSHTPVSLPVYRRIFDHEYNISFHRPIKDQCDLCVSFKNATEEQKAKMLVDFNIHMENKSLVREAKERDKVKSKTDESLVCACFDLQEILLTPRSFESCLYYKRRLNTFNFSMYDMANKNGHCFVWNESISNRGACDVASCIYYFIQQKALEGKKKFIFYSDNCSGQNKNRYYVTMLWYCLQKFNLTSITHKYLEKGHTQNENDSIHATIESASKNIKVFTTAQWAAIIRMARRSQQYSVKEMSFKDFFDFKCLSQSIKNFEVNTNGDKIFWNKIKVISLTSQNPNFFEYQTRHHGLRYHADLFKRLRSNLPDPCKMMLPQLRVDGIPISRQKFTDLISLCKKQIIPAVHHPFFLLLPHETE